MRSGSVCFGFCPDKAPSYCWRRQYIRFVADERTFRFRARTNHRTQIHHRLLNRSTPTAGVTCSLKLHNLSRPLFSQASRLQHSSAPARVDVTVENRKVLTQRKRENRAWVERPTPGNAATSSKVSGNLRRVRSPLVVPLYADCARGRNAKPGPQVENFVERRIGEIGHVGKRAIKRSK